MDRPELESREVRDVAETEGARRATGVSAGDHPDPEVPERAKRRQFSAEYKLRIVREADACKGSGEIGALLRREGLYSSHLVLQRRLKQAETIIEIQKKVAGMLGIPLNAPELDEND